MSTALAESEVVAACCGHHRLSGCCGPDCEPCCPDCPRCPALRIERYGSAVVADVDATELLTMYAIEFVGAFNPDALAEAAAEVAELGNSFPHMEGSVT